LSKTKKIEKEFLLGDSTVNSYGFRLLTSGYLMGEYQKNPIGFHMHDRPAGVLVRWDDLRVDGDCIYGKPVINMSNPRAQQTIDEIENGFLNAASLGHFVVLEFSNDESLKLPNQEGPTVTKWFNRECSLVDIPGNFNALTLFDKDENPINLSDFTKTKNPTMKQIIINGAQLSALHLRADADESAFNSAFNDLVAKAAKVDASEKALNDLRAQVSKDKVEGILTPALASKKLTVELADKLRVDYATNPDGLKNLVDAMPTYQPITKQLEADKDFGKDLADKSWDELMQSGQLANLKAKNPELFRQIYVKEFGTEPK
jgi:hypothetical protein